MLVEGQRLNNTYIVKRKLGFGGFGEVYLADDENIPDRQVAIKVLTRTNPHDQDDLLSEMKTLARFNHPNIVSFYHHFTDAERLFLVMEYCANGSLHDFLESKGVCAESVAIPWAVELCDTLAFVHGKRIVHHDIKPQNILFAHDGQLKIVTRDVTT
jgi:serine/threonine protein kinase